MNKIRCPHCKKLVSIDEAVKHELEETILKQEREKQKIALEKEKMAAKEKAEKKLNAEINKKLESADKEKKALEEKLRKQEEEKEKIEEKIKLEARKKAEEEIELKLKQKDIQLEQARKANLELNRKLEQGSQQLQGEALEINFEEKLKSAFPNDEFLPVPKGIEGGDIWQKIYFKGKLIGSILWELKRTKAWSNQWITKLKDDAAKISASESIIVSQVLPDKITSFDRKSGIWITGFEHAINTCRFIRFLITSIASIKSSTNQTDEEWGKIRDYMLSDSFKHRMQAHFDSVKALRENLDAERRSAILRWKKQEVQIEKLDTNTINFYGELKAIASDLPEIEGLSQLEAGNESEEEI